MRCTRCILPDTIPGITFDAAGTCNYCGENFPNYHPKGDEALARMLADNVRPDAPADCLVGVSGGKDSTCTLVTLKERFGMRVEAFTYVHDGSTPFSIENAKRACERHGITHHLVALPAHRHLATFTGFLDAWLRAPSPTTAGMTCVACKHLHLLGLDLARRRGIPMIAWSESPLEYSPFLALKYEGDEKDQYKREGNAKGAMLLLRETFRTRAFFTTLLRHLPLCYKGCLSAFPTSPYLAARYPDVTPIFFYEYHPWDPAAIRAHVREHAGWEAPGGKEDWHSDCMFNAFKEYMFLAMFGASYTDAFLSNQIRHGMLSRDDAMKHLAESRANFAVEIGEVIRTLDLKNIDGRIDPDLFLRHAG